MIYDANVFGESYIYKRQQVFSAPKKPLPTDLPTFQAHGAGVLSLGLLSIAVPMILVAYCWSRIPRLSDVELVGGTYFPSISVRWNLCLTTSKMVRRKMREFKTWFDVLMFLFGPSKRFQVFVLKLVSRRSTFGLEDSGSHWLLELWKHDSKVDD